MEKIIKLLEENRKKLTASEAFDLHRKLIRTITSELNCVPMTHVEITVLTAALKYIEVAYTSLLNKDDLAVIEALNTSLSAYVGKISAGEVE